METFTGLFFIATAIVLICISWMMDTKNMQSFVVFKLIPFVLGISATFLALNHYGFVIQI